MDTLTFAYNAKSGVFNTLTDYVHKIISPKTYSCNLCALTYGNLGMKKEWREFLESLNLEIEFIHQNELEKQFKSLAITQLPVIFITQNGSTRVLCNSKEINSKKTIIGLMDLVREKLA